jgi:predicted nucleic acid-binding protein
MGLMDAVGDGPLGLDTAIFIYFIEQHPVYGRLLAPLFQHVEREQLRIATSALTLLETLVVPYRAGDEILARKYEAILTNGRGLTLVAIDAPLIRLAAQIRAATSARTPDALQLASALTARCTAFLTNDKRLSSLPSLRVLQLDTFAE